MESKKVKVIIKWPIRELPVTTDRNHYRLASPVSLTVNSLDGFSLPSTYGSYTTTSNIWTLVGIQECQETQEIE